MQYMNETDWAEFRQKFPDAASWMDHRTLRNELQHLRSVAVNRPHQFTKWQSERLHELESWELSVMTPQEHVDILFPQAQKHANVYQVAWMICTMDNEEGTGYFIRQLSYADDPEFEAFDGKVEVVVEPQSIPPAGSAGSKYGYDEHGRLCHRDTRELVH